MSGRHKLSELDKYFTPEDWERIAELEAEIDATMPPDEASAVMPMRTMRELEDAPLSEYAAEMQTDEAGVLAFEECDDAPVSRIGSYIKAMGGRMKIVAEFPDGDEVIIANFYRKRRWPIRSTNSLFGRWEPIPEAATGPTTYRALAWAAQTYRQRQDGRRYDASYRKVYTGEFRDALRNGCSECDIKRLLGFLNQWGAEPSVAEMTPLLMGSVPDAVASLRHLETAPLDGGIVTLWDTILATRAVDRLMAGQGIDVTLASKILGLANPELFVMWDGAIQKGYFPLNDPDDGHAASRYIRFLCEMEDAAKSIRHDASEQHGITDLAGHLSQALGLNPPYTLAKFIDEYNFLTITKGEIYPALGHHQEHHA